MEHTSISLIQKRVRLCPQTGGAPQVLCTSPLSFYEVEVFTRLSESNKLFSEMKVQLQPYETQWPD